MKVKASETKFKYDPSEIEQKWQGLWKKNKVYSPNLDAAKKPFFNLMMFPYPSASGMHVGNMYAFTGADVFGRFMRMRGFDVFEPIGLDGFGIHSENYAIKVGRHPKEQAKISEANFYRQLRATGNGFDWLRKLETYDPKYYKWTQWLFIQLFKNGLAYRKKASVYFCPSCETVLADEQVIEGKCERCNSLVKKRDLEQWFFKITDYAERLLYNINKLDWTEKVKLAQKQWIGRSEGARIKFKIKGSHHQIEVFTTRPDTLFGATFIVVAPEHQLVSDLLGIGQKVMNYLSGVLVKKTEERGKKDGVKTDYKAIHPVTGEELPIWIADYVVMDYGSGAIMGVPAHDERDFEFAKKYGLSIKQVILRPSEARGEVLLKEPFIGEGIIINSENWNGWKMPESIGEVIDWLEKKGIGKREVEYHLRDWLISRQRYWGPPIPMIYCNKCDWQPVPESDLPVLLPDVKDWKPIGTGRSPLANHPEFYKVSCPNCGSAAKRETDVSDTFLDSAWYFFRYTSTDIDSSSFDIERVKKWLPVKMYIGGAEHSVLHLLYSRFITMVLHDLGFISFEEPFSRFYAHGLLIKEGSKMSKSKGNVVAPDQYIKKYGADTLRMYLMFLGPFSQGGDFYDTGIEGMHRFVRRIWILLTKYHSAIAESNINPSTSSGLTLSGVERVKYQISNERLRMMHKTIKKVTEDTSSLRYNTAIASLMEWYNYLSAKLKAQSSKLTREEAETFLKLLAPFAPHMAEEIFQFLRNSKLKTQNSKLQSIHLQPWPSFDPKFLEEDEVTIVVQVNGKVRDTITNHKLQITNHKYVEQLARETDKVKKYLQGKSVKKVVYVEGKVINFVTQ